MDISREKAINGSAFCIEFEIRNDDECPTGTKCHGNALKNIVQFNESSTKYRQLKPFF